MWPTLLKIGDFEIGCFGLMVAMGFFAAYMLILRRAKKMQFPEDQAANFVILCLIAGLLGAKLLHVIVYFGQAPVTELLFSRRGLVFYGGLIAGVGAGWIQAWRYGWDATTVADLVTPALPLGECFGRIGCLLNGCCFGRVCQNVLGVSFPRIEDQGQIVGSDPFIHQLNTGLVTPQSLETLPIYPTQMFSSLAALATFLLLVFFLEKRMRFRGQLALIYLLLYSISRFTIEIFRDDPRGTWIGGVSTSQGISVLVVAAALLLWVPLMRRAGVQGGLPKQG